MIAAQSVRAVRTAAAGTSVAPEGKSCILSAATVSASR